MSKKKEVNNIIDIKYIKSNLFISNNNLKFMTNKYANSITFVLLLLINSKILCKLLFIIKYIYIYGMNSNNNKKI